MSGNENSPQQPGMAPFQFGFDPNQLQQFFPLLQMNQLAGMPFDGQPSTQMPPNFHGYFTAYPAILAAMQQQLLNPMQFAAGQMGPVLAPPTVQNQPALVPPVAGQVPMPAGMSGGPFFQYLPFPVPIPIPNKNEVSDEKAVERAPLSASNTFSISTTILEKKAVKVEPVDQQDFSTAGTNCGAAEPIKTNCSPTIPVLSPSSIVPTPSPISDEIPDTPASPDCREDRGTVVREPLVVPYQSVSKDQVHSTEMHPLYSGVSSREASSTSIPNTPASPDCREDRGMAYREPHNIPLHAIAYDQVESAVLHPLHAEVSSCDELIEYDEYIETDESESANGEELNAKRSVEVDGWKGDEGNEVSDESTTVSPQFPYYRAESPIPRPSVPPRFAVHRAQPGRGERRWKPSGEKRFPYEKSPVRRGCGKWMDESPRREKERVLGGARRQSPTRPSPELPGGPTRAESPLRLQKCRIPCLQFKKEILLTAGPIPTGCSVSRVVDYFRCNQDCYVFAVPFPTERRHEYLILSLKSLAEAKKVLVPDHRVDGHFIPVSPSYDVHIQLHGEKEMGQQAMLTIQRESGALATLPYLHEVNDNFTYGYVSFCRPQEARSAIERGVFNVQGARCTVMEPKQTNASFQPFKEIWEAKSRFKEIEREIEKRKMEEKRREKDERKREKEKKRERKSARREEKEKKRSRKEEISRRSTSEVSEGSKKERRYRHRSIDEDECSPAKKKAKSQNREGAGIRVELSATSGRRVRRSRSETEDTRR